MFQLEPEVAVRSRCDPQWSDARRNGEIGDGTRCRVDLRHLAATVPGEPDVAVGPGRDIFWACVTAAGRG